MTNRATETSAPVLGGPPPRSAALFVPRNARPNGKLLGATVPGGRAAELGLESPRGSRPRPRRSPQGCGPRQRAEVGAWMRRLRATTMTTVPKAADGKEARAGNRSHPLLHIGMGKYAGAASDDPWASLPNHEPYGA